MYLSMVFMTTEKFKKVLRLEYYMSEVFRVLTRICFICHAQNLFVLYIETFYKCSNVWMHLRAFTVKKKQGLPQAIGILDSTLAVLPEWRRVLSAFPVVTWISFMEYIRSRVNLLATEEHLRELANQLQVMGEVGFELAVFVFVD